MEQAGFPSRWRRAVATGVLMVTGLCAFGIGSAHSDIVQKAEVDQGVPIPLGGAVFSNIIRDSASDQGHPGVILRDILAQLPAENIRGTSLDVAIASVGRDGSVGILAADTSPFLSETILEVDVINDEFVNLTPVPQRIGSLVQIDGGQMSLLGTRGSSVSYKYGLAFQDLSNGNLPDLVFQSGGTLSSDDLFNTNYSSDASNTFDIGATFDAATGSVTIPETFQTFDFGIAQPGDHFRLFYAFDFVLNQSGEGGTVSASFGDPFQVTGDPALGTIALPSPAPTDVPEPGSLSLIATGMLFLIAIRLQAIPKVLGRLFNTGIFHPSHPALRRPSIMWA